jgi:hypothetical protein
MKTSSKALLVAVFAIFANIGCHNSTEPGPTNNNQNPVDSTIKTNPLLTRTLRIIVHDEPEQQSGANVFMVVIIDSAGTYIPLPAGQSLVCNGSPLFFDDGSAEYKGPTPGKKLGGSYAFTLVRGLDSIPLAVVPVHARPVITTPKSGASVVRSSDFHIGYVADNTSKGVISSLHGGSVDLVAAQEEVDNGVSQSYDVTSVPTTGGWTQIVRHFQTVKADTAFKAIEANYYCGHVSGVSWK